MLTNLFCVNDEFTKQIVIFRGENAAYKFIEAILKEYQYCKKVMKKHVNKNLIMSEKEEVNFNQVTLTGFVKNSLMMNDENVRDHCHVTGKFIGAAHWDCNINLQLTKKVPVIFHYLRGYDSHLIFRKLHKFYVKIDVIPNWVEKYRPFF